MDFNLSSSYSKTPGINIQALGSQYKKTWRLGDLEVIISHYSAAISPIDKPTRSEMEQNCTVCLAHVCMARRLRRPCPAVLHLVSLAHALDDRYKHTGDIEDVERRINVCNTALGSEACGSWRPSLLCLLASALRVRFQLFGRAADLQQALDLHEEALTAHHSPSLERAWMLSEFGLSRFTQYNQYGNFETLVGSISLQQESLEMRPKGSLYRYRSLYCLGHTLWTRFTVLGKKEDLEASIRLSSEALDLCPVGHRDRHLPLHSLGNAYYRLYCETDDVSHLFSATSHFREALELRTTEHRDMRPLTLTNLSWMLRTQAGIQREPHTLNQAITFAREAMSLCPKGHWKRRHVANDLAIVLTDRYRLQCNVPDLEEAIMLQREALQVALGELAGSVPGMKPKAKADPRRHLTLHNLANNMHLHFQVTNNAHEHKEALLIQQQALDLLHDGHSDRAYCLFGLARLHLTGSSAAEEITTIMQLFSDAVRDPHRSEQLRLTDAVDVLDIFERRLHIGGFPINSRRMALRVYRLTISLLPRVAIFRTRAKLRLQVLAKAEHLAAHAAAHALYLEDPEVAIEVLEEGRAMFWTQHLRLRTSFDALPIEISGPLRSAACKLESTWTSPQAPGSAGVFWDNARQLDEEFETLVREARNLPGFSRFMLHETYGALSEAAERGPVVILIPNLLICHAIIIPEPEKPPLHVKLNISKDCLSKLSRALRSSGRFRRDLLTEELVVRAVKISHTPLQAEVVLEELWQKVVQPVVNELKLKVHASHTFCPSRWRWLTKDSACNLLQPETIMVVPNRYICFPTYARCHKFPAGWA